MDTGIDVERLLLCEIDDICFRRTFKDRDSLQLLKNSQCPLYCIEMPGTLIALEFSLIIFLCYVTYVRSMF